MVGCVLGNVARCQSSSNANHNGTEPIDWMRNKSSSGTTAENKEEIN